MHFDGIELDRSFAVGVPDQEMAVRLVVAIQSLAHTLDLKVCAKGIETPEQFEYFDELEVYKGQGYLISNPMPIAELLEYINMYSVHNS